MRRSRHVRGGGGDGKTTADREYLVRERVEVFYNGEVDLWYHGAAGPTSLLRYPGISGL